MNAVIQSLGRTEPKSVYRLASTSRNMYEKTSSVRSHLNALKRLVRRKKVRMRPRNNNLWENYMESRRRRTMTPAQRKNRIQWYLKRRAVPRAYTTYLEAPPGNKNTAWNRFVRTFVKSGGSANITRSQARQIYL